MDFAHSINQLVMFLISKQIEHFWYIDLVLILLKLLIIPHDVDHCKRRRLDFECKVITIGRDHFFYPSLLGFWNFYLSVGIAGCDENNISRERIPLESSINDHFFDVTQIICCVELIEKDPNFVPTLCHVFLYLLSNFFVPLNQPFFIDSSMNIKA